MTLLDRIGAVVFAAVAITSCEPTADQLPARTVQPGAPGEETRTLTADEAAQLDRPRYSEADVRFMHGMIPHHAQAIEMALLVPERTENELIHLLARRIDISQRDEIRLMERWLKNRGEALSGEELHQNHGGDDTLMPGMLTSKEMANLATATGSKFDRMFLEFMVRHHEGALIMVAELFSSVGGGQETEVHRFASDVDADQDMEIQRMTNILNEIP
jgi:uncharacterized protein (DUF305 family)